MTIARALALIALGVIIGCAIMGIIVWFTPSP